jgi:branched-chain amino acid transport system ATP-binding protein
MLAAPSQPGESLVKCLLRRSDVRRAERRVLGRAMEILELVRLSERRDAYAADLSGGQKKLLEIARALMTDCDLILLDEPCAGVNPALTNDIAALIVMLNRDHGKSFLIVEHHMAFVRTICDRVVVMTEGRRLTEGLFADIRRDERVISAYLGQSA